jgi:hypothetical protein
MRRSEMRARISPGGQCRWRCSVAVAAIGTRPDEAESLAALVLEEVGVDRRVEARVVELNREIVAASLLGVLGHPAPISILPA